MDYFQPRISPHFNKINFENYSAPATYTFPLPENFVGWSTINGGNEWTSTEFLTSPISTFSPDTLDTHASNRDCNPFDISFGQFVSYPEQELSSPVFSPNATPGSYLPSSPASTNLDPNLSPQQFNYSSHTTSPIDMAFSPLGPDAMQLSNFLGVDFPIKVIPARKRGSTTRRASKPGGDSVPTEKRSKLHRNKQRDDAGQSQSLAHGTRTIGRPLPRENASDSLSTQPGEANGNDNEKERHKHVEMKYRVQMKERFAELLQSLLDGGEVAEFVAGGDKKFTRGRVLDLAKERIDSLVIRRLELEREREELKRQASLYETAWLMRQGGILER